MSGPRCGQAPFENGENKEYSIEQAVEGGSTNPLRSFAAHLTAALAKITVLSNSSKYSVANSPNY